MVANPSEAQMEAGRLDGVRFEALVMLVES